jgi:hypothetical protein
MSPRVEAIITAQNRSRPAFGEVVTDSKVAADAVVANGRRANAALEQQSRALTVVGQSSAAAANQQRNLVFQLNDVAVSLAGGANPLMVFAQQGSQIASIYGPEEGGLGKALKETANLAVGMVTKFWPIAAIVGAGTAAVAGMTAEINKAGEQQVTFGDVATASWQTFAEGIYGLAQPAITAIGGWLGDMWSMAWPIIHDAGNGIIATFVGAFDASKTVWSAFPEVMGDFVITTVNNVIGGVEGMINGAIGLINDFKSSLGMAGDLGDVSFGGLDNPFEGAMGGVAEDVVGAFQGAFNVDYLGAMFDTISSKAKDLAAARQELDGIKESAAGAGNSIAEMGKQAGNATQSTLGAFGQLTGALGQLFNDNKAFAVASAVINTAEGVTKALAQGGLFGFVGAAAVAASGAAQIATILSASKGSGTKPSVSGGGGAAAASTAAPVAQRGGTSVNLTLLGGGRYSRNEIEALFRDINDALGDGMKLNVNPA